MLVSYRGWIVKTPASSQEKTQEVAMPRTHRDKHPKFRLAHSTLHGTWGTGITPSAAAAASVIATEAEGNSPRNRDRASMSVTS
jgi:hypothetical protein